LINAFGTEGDLRPFVALARGLTAAGHQAAICAPSGFAEFIAGYSVEHLPMGNEALHLIQTEMPSMRGPADSVRILRRMTPAMRRMMLDEWQAAQSWRPDMIVYHPKCLGALHTAERLDIPALISLPLPFFTPTRAFPIPFIGRWPLGGAANRASYAFNHFTMLAFGSMINTFRTETLGLRRKPRTDVLLHRHDGSPVPVLYSFSRHLVPPPADYPAHAHVTGAWDLGSAPDWTPPEDLVRFLEAGDPPVYVGFGSMGFGRGAERRTARIVDALTRQGARIVLATGWGGLAAATAEHLHTVRSVPHDWLFPRVGAVIHHGGSGTTHAGLRAGRPTLICPFLGDQPFWGHRVHAAGVGPAPLPVRKITDERLAPAIDRLINDHDQRQRAERLGHLIRAEHGVDRAVAVITGTARSDTAPER
jgi:sterol 3beta-glucosyltransferase